MNCPDDSDAGYEDGLEMNKVSKMPKETEPRLRYWLRNWLCLVIET